LKPLLVLARITFVGCLWSIIFIEGIRVIVLENWRFDIFWPAHWAYAWNLWQSGWVIDTPKEWAFVLILLAFIPLWLTGWIALSLVPWESIIYKIFSWPLKFIKGSVTPLAQAVSGSTPVVVKKKSYKEIRPTGKRVPIYDYNNNSSTAPITQPISSAPVISASNPTKDRAVSNREILNHAIFDLDDEDDDFDLDIDSFDKTDVFKIDSNKQKNKKAEEDFEKPKQTSSKKTAKISTFDLEDEEDDDLDAYEPAPSLSKSKRKSREENFDEVPSYRRENRDKPEGRAKSAQVERAGRPKQENGAMGDILEEKGYDVLRNIPIKKNVADYVAVSSDKLLLFVVDKEPGDWLADEERFNDEEPLWFSENSHRISPVRKADILREKFEKLLEESDLHLEIVPYVVVISGNIINAEDMLDVWADMGINVVRFAKGSPSDLLPFSKAVEEADGQISERNLSELKKLLKRLM